MVQLFTLIIQCIKRISIRQINFNPLHAHALCVTMAVKTGSSQDVIGEEYDDDEDCPSA